MARKSISVNTVKIQNRLAVFRELANGERLTRGELAERCGVSLGTVVTILDELAGQGLVVEAVDTGTLVGRKPNLVQLVGGPKRIVTLDLSSKNFAFSIMDLKLETCAEGRHRFQSTKSFEENLQDALAEMKAVTGELGLEDDQIVGVGISVPGPYNASSDRVSHASYPQLEHIPISATIRQYFGQPMQIEHDVFLAARAELRHVPDNQAKNIYYIFLGEGVGGALATQGEIYKGSRQEAGDLGRMYMTERETLEELVSWTRVGSALTTEFADRYDTPYQPARSDGRDGSTVANPPMLGLPAPIQEATRMIARALHNAFWVLDPDCFVIGGEYHRFGNAFLSCLVQDLSAYLPSEVMRTLEVRLARHGSRGALLGAGEVVRENWLSTLTTG